MALSEEATTKIAALLRLSTLASGAALAIMSIVSFFASIALLSPSAVIVAFYTVYGHMVVAVCARCSLFSCSLTSSIDQHPPTHAQHRRSTSGSRRASVPMVPLTSTLLRVTSHARRLLSLVSLNNCALLLLRVVAAVAVAFPECPSNLDSFIRSLSLSLVLARSHSPPMISAASSVSSRW